MTPRRVLVVEDDAFSRELLCDWLEMEGYEVLAATDLTAAQNALRSKYPEIVLLDVKLGAEDGLALATWIRKEPDLHHIPVVAVTAHAMLTERDRILEAGCNGFLSKPVDFRALEQLLQRWLSVNLAKSQPNLRS